MQWDNKNCQFRLFTDKKAIENTRCFFNQIFCATHMFMLYMYEKGSFGNRSHAYWLELIILLIKIASINGTNRIREVTNANKCVEHTLTMRQILYKVCGSIHFNIQINLAGAWMRWRRRLPKKKCDWLHPFGMLIVCLTKKSR